MGWRDQLLKNARNYAKYLEKKERGPVKAFFHITKNENVPAIDKEGLRANSRNANRNSSSQPFRKLGIKGGGIWVTDRPSSFPVYGSTIGGKGAERANALTTYKIELPTKELKKLPAVYDPYSFDMRLTNAAEPLAPFGTWANEEVGVTALLKDIPSEKIKNIGYVEELNPRLSSDADFDLVTDQSFGVARGLSKADRKALAGITGHDKPVEFNDYTFDMTKSPARFVEEYLAKHMPIKERSLKLPNDGYAYDTVTDPLQYPYQLTEENHGYLRELPITAADWTEMYRPYTKFGETPRKVIFQPGAYSRGMGTIPIENIGMNMGDEIRGRNFNWNTYLKGLQAGMTPKGAALMASPRYYLDWDNIVYNPKSGYAPNKIWPEDDSFKFNAGAISRGRPESSVRNIIEGPINIKQLSDVKKASTAAGDTPKKYLIDRLNITDAAASNELEAISENATWADIVRAVMKANVNSK